MLTTSPLSNHHLQYPLLQWGHNHYHTEGQMSPETQGDTLQDTSHPTWRCRTDIPLILHLCIPAQEPRRQRTLLEGGEIWALSYTWSLPPRCPRPPFFFILRHKRVTHWSRPKLASANHHCLHQMETDTSEDTASTRHQHNRWRILTLTSRPRSHV